MSSEDFDKWEEDRRRRQEEREWRRAERRREALKGRPEGTEPGSEARAERAEGRSEGGCDRRKEKVLHTRISESLDDTIRHAADELRVPVSNLVRNVLEDVFDVVEKVTDNVGDLLDDVLGESDRVGKRYRRRLHRRGERGRASERTEAADDVEPEAAAAGAAPDTERESFPEVVGWQPLILNGEQSCADCGRELRRGDRGFVGISATGPSSHYLCRECANTRG